MASLSCSACPVSSFHYSCAWWELADCLHGYSHIHIPKKCESWPLESPWLVVPARCVDQLACVHRKSKCILKINGNSVNHGESAMRSSGTLFFWRLQFLVICYIAIENGHRNSEFSPKKRWFSIVFCMFTRGYSFWTPKKHPIAITEDSDRRDQSILSQVSCDPFDATGWGGGWTFRTRISVWIFIKLVLVVLGDP